MYVLMLEEFLNKLKTMKYELSERIIKVLLRMLGSTR